MYSNNIWRAHQTITLILLIQKTSMGEIQYIYQHNLNLLNDFRLCKLFYNLIFWKQEILIHFTNSFQRYRICNF